MRDDEMLSQRESVDGGRLQDLQILVYVEV